MHQHAASAEKNTFETPAEGGPAADRGHAGLLPSLRECLSQMASDLVERRIPTNNRRAFMKTTMLTMMILALLTCFVMTGPVPVMAEPSGSTSMARGGVPSPEKIPHDKQTDLTPGQPGVPDEYATTPVRQGKLKEVTDSKWLNQPATNTQGEQRGKITKVLKDEHTQNLECHSF